MPMVTSSARSISPIQLVPTRSLAPSALVVLSAPSIGLRNPDSGLIILASSYPFAARSPTARQSSWSTLPCLSSAAAIVATGLAISVRERGSAPRPGPHVAAYILRVHADPGHAHRPGEFGRIADDLLRQPLAAPRLLDAEVLLVEQACVPVADRSSSVVELYHNVAFPSEPDRSRENERETGSTCVKRALVGPASIMAGLELA